MGIKSFLKFLLIITAFFILLNSCGKDCTQTSHSFQIKAKIPNANDSINVGDTIWLQVIEPALLKDLSTNTNIDYSSAENLSTVITFTEIAGVNKIEYANDKFAIQIIKGIKINQNQFGIEFLFSEENKMYLFKLGIIPLQKGIFRFNLSDAANVFRKNDKCTKATFILDFKETLLHTYFYKFFDPNAIINSNDIGNTYYFKVK